MARHPHEQRWRRWGATFDEVPEPGWDKVVDLNLKSLFFLTQALHCLLKASGSSERIATAAKVGGGLSAPAPAP